MISATSGSGGFSTASITSALESLAFFDQRSKGLGICFLDTGQFLKVAGLPTTSQIRFGLRDALSCIFDLHSIAE